MTIIIKFSEELNIKSSSIYLNLKTDRKYICSYLNTKGGENEKSSLQII